MNWLKTIRALLGRFWGEIFQERDFLLGVEYLLSIYSKLVDNQYLNWRNGLIAVNTDVAQARLPFVILIDTTSVEQEWYQWQKLWQSGSASLFYNHSYTSPAAADMGWILKTKNDIDVPDYMVDHVLNYSKILIKGSDYDYENGRFLFYTDPASLDLPLVKETDEDGNPHVYYRLFGYAFQPTKVCDPVTGFESQWLNGCSDIAWDIHQNGATYYNTKRLLGKATGSVICEEDGTIAAPSWDEHAPALWNEQDYHCCMVNDKPYISKHTCNFAAGAAVTAGSVLFGSLKMYKGSDTVSAADVPGIKIMTDAGSLTAMNTDMPTYISPGADHTIMLPLAGPPLVLNAYRASCAELVKDEMVPYIQIPYPTVNPYEFIVKTLRRGRSVTIRLIADDLDYLAAAIACIRKSSCASGMLNIYVAASTDANSAATLTSSVFSADAGMMAVATVETLTIKKEAAEARVIL